ncbi:hypothetical protein [Vagococcus lutrae]|uniref:hypothetical protein n=1 Tax=Vagococcus lutrae TaxID=81947 RepID=UPI002010A47D|nr:hypothetical protein [Vagococcus lutrae]MDY3706445.1 hypothetical protein [Vagococcus lutrae]UQF38044.1 hypothetical protein M2904_07990 [Vagococcus lutrae]
MVSLNNQLSLYNKVTEDLESLVGIHVLPTKLSYTFEGDEKSIEITNYKEPIISINDYDDLWSPAENDLKIRQSFVFDKPSFLYGRDSVTLPNNELGIAVHIHSKASNFQQTINFGTIPNSYQQHIVEFNHVFSKSTLRGNINFDFFLYLKSLKSKGEFQATKVGMIVSENDLLNLSLIVDGVGSEFPMTEFHDKGGPLWQLEKNWIDAEEDLFVSSNVNLSLNTAHPLFEQLKNGKTKLSRAMMDDILIQAMSLIIQQVIIIDQCDINEEDGLPNSILSAVRYWVSTFDIDVSNVFSINNSLKKVLSNIGGENERKRD